MKLFFLGLFWISSHAAALVTQSPWPEGLLCARHIGVNGSGNLTVSFAQYRGFAGGLSETISIYRRLHNNPELKLSLEQLQYTLGDFKIMRPVEYAATCEDFDELDADTTRLLELQNQRKLTPSDFGGSAWIHMVTAIGQDELMCLNYVERNGQVTGCGDIWQGGLTEDEVVCREGKTLLKCHVECITRLNNSNPTIQPGFCHD